MSPAPRAPMPGATAATKSGIDYEDRAICWSPRSEGSPSGFCCGRDGDYADREFDFDNFVLSAFAARKSRKRKRLTSLSRAFEFEERHEGNDAVSKSNLMG